MSADDQLYIRINDVFQFSPCIKNVRLVFCHVVSALWTENIRCWKSFMSRSVFFSCRPTSNTNITKSHSIKAFLYINYSHVYNKLLLDINCHTVKVGLFLGFINQIYFFSYLFNYFYVL